MNDAKGLVSNAITEIYNLFSGFNVVNVPLIYGENPFVGQFLIGKNGTVVRFFPGINTSHDARTHINDWNVMRIWKLCGSNTPIKMFREKCLNSSFSADILGISFNSDAANAHFFFQRIPNSVIGFGTGIVPKLNNRQIQFNIVRYCYLKILRRQPRSVCCNRGFFGSSIAQSYEENSEEGQNSASDSYFIEVLRNLYLSLSESIIFLFFFCAFTYKAFNISVNVGNRAFENGPRWRGIAGFLLGGIFFSLFFLGSISFLGKVFLAL